MLNISMRDFYKSKNQQGIYHSCFTIIPEKDEELKNSVTGSIVINMNTQKIKIRIAFRYKRWRYIPKDKAYLLSYDEKILLFSELFQKLYFSDEKLPYDIVTFEFIESNRADKEFKEEFVCLIDELKKYRFEYNKKNKIILRILNSLYVIENWGKRIVPRRRSICRFN